MAESAGEHEVPLYPAIWLHQVPCLLKGVALYSRQYSTIPPRTRQTQAKADEIGNEDVATVPQYLSVSGSHQVATHEQRDRVHC